MEPMSFKRQADWLDTGAAGREKAAEDFVPFQNFRRRGEDPGKRKPVCDQMAIGISIQMAGQPTK